MPRIAHRALVAASLTACAAPRPSPPPAARSAAPVTQPAMDLARVDHVIVGIDSLERGVELLRAATGLTAVAGGAHPGRGTHNALLALGPGQYLELLAPNPRDPAPTTSAIRHGLETYHALTPVGWAVAATDIDALAATLRARGLPGGAVVDGARRRPDGATLRWRTLDPFGVRSDLLPFFIEWAPDGPHPSASAPAGCTLAAMALAAPDPAALGALLGRAELDLPVAAGPREAMSLVLDCPAGRVTLPAP